MICIYDLTLSKMKGGETPGSKLLSKTTQLHCGSLLGGRARLPDTILEEDHQMTIPSKLPQCIMGDDLHI
jgi:hypothetical protein